MAVTISGSVGLQGRNTPADVFVVQQLLNGVPESLGGPPKPIAVDGLVGPETIGAIRRFQMKNFGSADGRVDPNGRTIVKLGGMASSAAPMGKPSGAGGKPQGTAGPNNIRVRPPDIFGFIVSAQGAVLIDAPGLQGFAMPGQQIPTIGVLWTLENSTAFVRFLPSERMVFVPASAIFFLDQEGPILTQSGAHQAPKPAPYYQVGKTPPKPAPYYRVGNGNPATPPAPYYQVGKSSGQKPAPYYRAG